MPDAFTAPQRKMHDDVHLKRALKLAWKGRYGVSPNPMVGAVVVRQGEVVGEGFHAVVGGPHAEVVALEAAGARARGATVYITLEPCAHHGRTPPCTEALIAAGVRRVVACHPDPDSRVAGQGFERLAAAGIEVAWRELADEAARLNLRYLVPKVLGRPLVTLKWAMSLDGKIATVDGESQWISGAPARRWALDLRELHDAILVGSGTVLADDPRLNRRLGHAGGEIVRVVLDRRLRVPPDAHLFRQPGPVLLYTESASPRSRARALAASGAEVVDLQRLTAAAVLADLHARGIHSVLVEGGPTVAALFSTAGLYDRVYAVCAPLLIGGARAPGPLAAPTAAELAGAPRIEGLRARRRGDDLILEGLRSGCLRELSSSWAQ